MSTEQSDRDMIRGRATDGDEGSMRKRVLLASAAVLMAVTTAACASSTSGLNVTSGRTAHLKPVPEHLMLKMAELGMTKEDPIFMRIYKEESKLEVWKRNSTGLYAKLHDYEICKYSGELGPKFKEGDKQAPEGFYTVRPQHMNPNSQYHLSFNLGYPNPFDRAHNRTGAHLMVHGDCLSAGCYAMEDPYIEEIYALAREAFDGGQEAFQVQAFPFRMTPENLARHRDSPHKPFWMNLKDGADHFDLTLQPPLLDYCGRQYVFNTIAADGSDLNSRRECPQLAMYEPLRVALEQKRQIDQQRFQVAVAKIEGSPLPGFDPNANVQIAGTSTQSGPAQAGPMTALRSVGNAVSAVATSVTSPAARQTGTAFTTSAPSSAASGYTASVPASGDPFSVFDGFVQDGPRSLPRHMAEDLARDPLTSAQ
jgi:murein L,D-transpeptidase YafK